MQGRNVPAHGNQWPAHPIWSGHRLPCSRQVSREHGMDCPHSRQMLPCSGRGCPRTRQPMTCTPNFVGALFAVSTASTARAHGSSCRVLGTICRVHGINCPRARQKLPCSRKSWQSRKTKAPTATFFRPADAFRNHRYTDLRARIYLCLNQKRPEYVHKETQVKPKS